jgi:hypothetical protein
MNWQTSVGLVGLAIIAGCAAGSTSGTGDLGGGSSSGGAENGAGDDGGSQSGSSGGNSSGSDLGNASSSGGSGRSSSSGAGGSSGSTNSSGSSGTGGSETDAAAPSGPSGGSGAAPTMLPTVMGTCPTITPGMSAKTVTFAGEPVELWTGTPSGDAGGPLVMYWFPTTGTSDDVEQFFGPQDIAAVTAKGGMVASFAKSTTMGTNTGDAVWYTGDFAVADQVVACAIQSLKINTRQIYVTGASAGALQATWMSYVRSGYIAAAVTLSGGLDELSAGASLTPTTLQDPSNVPSIMAVHGAKGSDVVVIDFAVASASWEADIASKHGFSMDCNTGGGHVSGPPQILPGVWQFMEDHPFKVITQPYPPIPSIYPSYCKIGPVAAM